MSIKWIGHYWEDGPREVKQRYVLVAIADNANDEGYAYPSIALIAKKTLIPIRTVQRVIANLEKLGWLDRTLRGADKPQKSGQKTTGYQLHWKPEPKTKGCQIDTSLPNEGVPNETLKGCQIEHEGVPNEAAPLMYLTVNESSGEPKAPFKEILSGEKVAKGERTPAVDVTPPGQPSPRSIPNPNPEAQTLAGMIVCASPYAVLRSMSDSDVNGAHRTHVLNAARHEAREHGISKMEALRGLLQIVEAQVARLPRDQLRYLGDIENYFMKRNYRIEPAHIKGDKSNGFAKGDSVENALRQFREDERRNSGEIVSDGAAALGSSRTIDAESLRRRLM